MIQRNEITCPRCGTRALIAWAELSGEDRDLFMRLNPEFREHDGPKNTRICTHCWFVDDVALHNA